MMALYSQIGFFLFKQLLDTLQNDTYITLETTPSHSPQFRPIVDKIEALELHNDVVGFSTTDNPLAKLKYSALFAAQMLQQRLNKPVLATMSMRDRNRIALQSDILGANEVDVRAFLALTGDPATISDQPNSKGVFEGNSNLLLEIISCLNSGIDYAGKPLTVKPEPIYPFTVINAYAKNLKTLQKKMQKKIENGSLGIITQPVFDIENVHSLLELLDGAKSECCDKGSNSELIIGLFPITRFRTAQFLSAHVPGINVPKYWVEKLRDASEISKEQEYKAGFELSKNLFDEVKKTHPKIHLMTANKFELAKDILTQ